MKPEYIGRVLGTGVRVAGRLAGQRMAAASVAAGGPQVRTNTQVESGSAGKAQAVTETGRAVAQAGRAAEQAGRAAVQAGRGVSKGLGGFLRPFQRVGGILWLEITGAFFLLPVVVFAPTAWRTRASWAAGPDHRTFLASVVVVAVFFYLGVSSFWRARRKSRA